MDKIKLTKIEDIKKHILCNNLTNIVVETGNGNFFIPNKNKFIVTKYFLHNANKVFSCCDKLQKIDMQNFDFSSITSLNEWFSLCDNLKEITFPTSSNCQKLQTLRSCFGFTKIQFIDLSFMETERMLDLSYSFSNSNAKKIILPKSNVLHLDNCFKSCDSLEELVAPISIYANDFKNTFSYCKNLKLIDFSNGKGSTEKILNQLTNKNTNNILPEDCVVILPNAK